MYKQNHVKNYRLPRNSLAWPDMIGTMLAGPEFTNGSLPYLTDCHINCFTVYYILLQLASYGGQLHYNVKFSIDTSAPWQYHLAEPDVILQVILLSFTVLYFNISNTISLKILDASLQTIKHNHPIHICMLFCK